MPKSCSAYNCKNRYSKDSGIGFHQFPKDEIKRKLWTFAVRRDKWKPSPNAVLCSEHFAAECYYIKHGRRTLKPDTIPSIFDFTNHQEKKKKNFKKRRKASERKPRAVKRNHSVDDEMESNASINNDSEHNYASLKPKKNLKSLTEKNLQNSAMSEIN